MGGLMHEKLKAVVDSIDYYQSTYPEDACILIFDTEKVIGYKPGHYVDLKIRLGETVEKHKNTTSVRAMHSKKFLREERNAQLFGFAYIASASPIYDNGKVIGVVTGVISNNRMSNMREVANELTSSVQEMAATTEVLAQSSLDVSNRIDELSRFADTMNSNIEQINEVVNSVKAIALKSRILGLNASIEAARSGEHGKGFAVVAKEIQKMAENSNQSADDIALQLANITDAIQYINTSTTQIASFTEEYTMSMHEISGTFTEMNTVGRKLLELSEIDH